MLQGRVVLGCHQKLLTGSVLALIACSCTDSNKHWSARPLYPEPIKRAEVVALGMTSTDGQLTYTAWYDSLEVGYVFETPDVQMPFSQFWRIPANEKPCEAIFAAHGGYIDCGWAAGVEDSAFIVQSLNTRKYFRGITETSGAERVLTIIHEFSR